jgi:hypothetical protein
MSQNGEPRAHVRTEALNSAWLGPVPQGPVRPKEEIAIWRYVSRTLTRSH